MRHDLSKINKKKCLLVGCCCLVMIFLLLFLFRSKTPPAVDKAVIKPDVETYAVVRKDMLRRASLFGETVSNSRVALAPKYAGRIIKVNVELGDHVKQGDILLVQDTKDLDLSIAQNNAAIRQSAAEVAESESAHQATYNKVKSDYELKKRKYERYSSLYAQGGISKQELDMVYQEMVDSKSAYDVNQAMFGEAPASVEIKRAALEKAEIGTASFAKQRDDLILRAPRDGVIAFRDAEVGEIAQAGKTVLELVDNSKIYIDCSVSEQDVAFVRPDMLLKAGIESLGKTYRGKIVYISPSVAADSKNYMVRIELLEHDGLIKAGMFARSQIEFLQRPATVTVPKEAVLEKNGKTSVFIIDGQDRAQERSVAIGLRNDQEVEVLEGLSEGEVVAISNLARLRDQVEVHVVSGAGDKS